MTFAFIGFGVSTIMSLGTALVVVALVFAAINYKSAARVAKAARAQAGNIGRAVMNMDPMTIYKQRLDDEGDRLSQARKSLADAGVLVRSVQRQVTEGEKERSQIESRIKAALANGDKDKAREYALRMKTVESVLETNRLQLKLHQDTYAKYETQIADSTERLARYRREAKSLDVQLQLSEKAKAVSAPQLGLDDDELDTQRDAVMEQIDRNQAMADASSVGNALATYEAQDRKADDQAAADEILARYS